MLRESAIPSHTLEHAAPLTLTLFGPMQILVGGQPIVRLRSRKTLWLLALLVLRGGRPVERVWLAETLWPDIDPTRSLSSLRAILSDLRAALGAEGARLRSTSGNTLSLDIAGAEIDVLAFDAAVASGKIPALERAVALYQGTLLEGCGEEWAGQEQTAREQDCLRALGKLADAAMAAGDWAAAADYSQRAAVMDPWREEARRGWMEALARAGNVNAALQVYHEFARLLRDDSNMAPEEPTTALYTRLRAEARGGAQARSAAADDGAKAALPAAAGRLPHPLTELIGREDEREEVAARLRRSRLVTLTGPGGIGKTRLALAVAREVAPEFADGVWMVALEALTDGAHVAGQIAATLGMKETPNQALLEALTAHLRSKRLLLVLDNCEHVLAGSARAALHLLGECAGLRILATSREALGLADETAWVVPALTSPDPAHLPAPGTALLHVMAGYGSVQLFVERAQAVRNTFALTRDNALAVAQICARLEGIPLALELAAARVRGMTAEQLAERLDQDLTLLTGGNRTSAPRQQTLRAALDWSYAPLTEPERLLWERVSVFAGGWTRDAAEAVWFGDEPGALPAADLLKSLVDKSLASFDAHATGGGRYRLLEMVRQYASERLEASGAAATVRARHQAWFLALAEDAEAGLRGPEQAKWVDRLETEHDNLRAALAWLGKTPDEAGIGLRMAGALGPFWELRGYYREGRAALSAALGRNTDSGQTPVRAKALRAAGVLAYYEGDYAEAQTLHEQGVAMYRELGDQSGAAWGLNDLGDVFGARGDQDAARALYTESLTIFREAGNRRGVAQLLHHLGRVMRDQGDYGEAKRLYEDGLAMQRELGDQEGIAWALHHLGHLAAMQGDLPLAWSVQEEGLTIFRELGSRQGAAWALQELGKVAEAQSDHETAQALYSESLAIFRELGNRQGVAHLLRHLGLVTGEQRDYAQAKRLLEESLAIFRQLDSRQAVADLLRDLAGIAARRDRLEAEAAGEIAAP
ncbi:hypothetical protein CCAX7_005860 [Capsulimonas corticalis]|uniref:Uncharacterized protein n=1 Tax=Capsulimonas corticalis TaxID=2219043 RepID=A0A402D3D2_9BACT|nr:tetratricopeptide repeat protein [Capsulimonas corticalis]BDI28535.1 hypothetical protein CCAX7_005860 [Capsulimonas corticalis]